MIAEREAPPSDLPHLVPAVPTSHVPAGAPDDQPVLIESLRTELEGARAANANFVAMSGQAVAKFQAEIGELRNDRDEWRRTTNEFKEKHSAQVIYVKEQAGHIEELLEAVGNSETISILSG